MKVKITTLLVACLFFAVSLKSQTIRIGIASDLHYFDQSLLIANGTAFQTYIMMDRKLIAESHAITRSMIDSFKTQNLNIVLITGDLTKDGEKSSHQKLAAMFQELEDAGTKVFVVPGNHDINNPEAFSYDGSKTNVVATVTPQEFISIYGNFGYNEAIYKDSGSLTYIAEPVNGLWILGIDDCKYKNNATLGHSETAGDLSRETRTWIAMKLNEAREKNIKVIGLIHHGILEHFTGQKSMFSEYVIDNYDSISNDLGAHGLSVVFSGHFHAHDARVKNLGNKDICDVETGSSVTYPCPYRIAELKTDNKLYITSKRITKITYNTGSKTFQEYALDYIKTGLPVLVKYMLKSPPYNLNDSLANLLEPAVTETMIAHYEGDEKYPSPSTAYLINYLKQNPSFASIGYVLDGIWNDPAPTDWTLTIDMMKGTSIEKNSKPSKCNNFITSNESTVSVQLNSIENKEIISLKMINTTGQLVYEKTLQNQDNIIFNNPGKGLYFIVVEGKNSICTDKVFLQ